MLKMLIQRYASLKYNIESLEINLQKTRIKRSWLVYYQVIHFPKIMYSRHFDLPF